MQSQAFKIWKEFSPHCYIDKADVIAEIATGLELNYVTEDEAVCILSDADNVVMLHNDEKDSDDAEAAYEARMDAVDRENEIRYAIEDDL